MIFVGRRSELHALEGLLDGALRGSGAVAMLSGDPGIGKTRTAEEFATTARSRGAGVVWAKCFEGPSLPYAPWPAALASDWPQESGLPALSAEDERLRLFEAVSAAVCNRQTPLILILDDLHLAQPSALQLLEHVSHSVPNAPVLIVGTHSDVGVDLAHPLTRCLAELRRNALFVNLELEPLAPPDVRALVEALADEPDAELLRHVEKETAGNPFFITEVVTHLDAGGTIPATIRQAVGSRLARLSVNTNRILSLASAFSDAFDFRALQAASDLTEEAVLEAVDEGLTARIIRPAGGERYEFAHRLFQQTLQQEMSPSRRSRLHRRIVRAFEELAAAGFDLPAAELARQYDGSRSLPGAEHGVPYALEAADQAERAAAPEDVVAFLRMARDLGGSRAAILPRLAVAEIRAMLADDAVSTIEAATRELRTDAQVAELLRIGAWELEDVGAPRELITPLVVRALRLAPSGTLTWARLKLAEYPVDLLSSGPWPVGRWRGYEPEAIRLARERGDENDYARTLHLADWRTIEEIRDLHRLVRRWRTPAAAVQGLSVVARSLIVRYGSFREAEEACAELLELSTRVGSVVGRADASLYAAHSQLARGEFNEAHANLGAARRLIEKLGPEHRLRTGLGLAEFILAYFTGEAPERWVTDVATSTTPPWMTPITLGITTLATVHQGDRDRAEQLLEVLVPLLTQLDPTTVNNNAATALAAEVAWELNDTHSAEPLRDVARGIIERGVGDYTLTSNELAVARMAALLGDRDQSAAFFERARNVLAAEDRWPLLAIVERDEARSKLQHRKKAGLTRREIEVLRLLASGRTNKELAGELVLSVHTIERHLANAYRKIGARNRADATAFVLRERL